MLKAEFEFIFKDKIEYAVGGNTKIATNLTIKAPSYVDTKSVFKLHSIYRQGVLRYIEKNKDNKSEQNEVISQEVTHEDEVNGIIGILINSDCDSDRMFDIFNDLLVKSAKVDGKEPLTPFLISKLSPQETLRCLGEYLVNFPIAV